MYLDSLLYLTKSYKSRSFVTCKLFEFITMLMPFIVKEHHCCWCVQAKQLFKVFILCNSFHAESRYTESNIGHREQIEAGEFLFLVFAFHTRYILCLVTSPFLGQVRMILIFH